MGTSRAAAPFSASSTGVPITASGFVDHGAIVFEDATKAAGLAGWSHHVGDGRKDFIVESLGSGVALLDYDGDGWMDIYLVNSLTYTALAGTSPPPTCGVVPQ